MKASSSPIKPKKIKRLLIANRGEIACRIISTAQRMGIETIAVYADADKNAKHVTMADVAIHIGPSPASQSYLNIDVIIQAAKTAKADAIHPGYGFLSENALFAEKCLEAHIIFIGPSPHAIRAMGIKDEAKAIMEKAGVPILPGYHGSDQSIKTLKKAALDMGLPIMIKAVAGGGGKGMRIVNESAELEDALQSAQRESQSAFGNNALMLEKYLDDARHIEVQVFADQLGNVVHLFERDCSIQRRYQKIIEEAPSLHIPEAVKTKLYQTAIEACKAIHYCGAGTLEYLYQDKQFYFMEMNTRLQVEHPVTEGITGLDLVEWQICVAEGRPLPLKQGDIKAKNHAIEVRIYAEDPSHNFLPATGVIQKFFCPSNTSSSASYRLDTGVREKDEIGIYYDPMIAKLTVVEDREAAVKQLHQVLLDTEVVGLKTNLSLLRRISNESDYQKGHFTTRYLDKHPPLLLENKEKHFNLSLLCAFLYHYSCERQQAITKANEALEPFSPWYQVSGWHVNAPAALSYFYYHWDEKKNTNVNNKKMPQLYTLDIDVLTDDDLMTIKLSHDKSTYHIRGLQKPDNHLLLFTLEDIKHQSSTPQRARITPIALGVHVYLSEWGVGTEIIYPEKIKEDRLGHDDSTLNAPLPGIITRVLIKSGDKVVKGQKLLIMEAMKMEHTIVAPSDGLINKVLYEEGAQIQDGVPLFDFEATVK